jgi:hypothetical protein
MPLLEVQVVVRSEKFLRRLWGDGQPGFVISSKARNLFNALGLHVQITTSRDMGNRRGAAIHLRKAPNAQRI